MSFVSADMSKRTLRNAGWVSIYGTILGAWVLVLLMATTRPGRDIPLELWASLCASAGEARLGALWLMWSVMVLAMMLPTFVPSLRTYADLKATGAASQAGLVALALGYVVVWIGAAGFGALAQAYLARSGLVSPLGQSLSPYLSGGLLLGAGLYQFSALKEACLSKCRHPLTSFLADWREGLGGSFQMGVRQGMVCLGCCWVLMGLGFVGGTMALGWMAVATLFMTFEKLPAFGRYLTKPVGWALVLSAPLPFLF